MRIFRYGLPRVDGCLTAAVVLVFRFRSLPQRASSLAAKSRRNIGFERTGTIDLVWLWLRTLRDEPAMRHWCGVLSC